MIFDKLINLKNYESLNVNFAQVADFIKTGGLKNLKPGRNELRDGVFAMLETVKGKSRDRAVLEAHKKYIDIQLCLNFTDNIGWRSVSECDDVRAGYNPDKDIAFFNNRPEQFFSRP